MIASPPNPKTSKALGAFYTPREVAEFLVQWAIRSPADVVFDTSSGGGVFLKAAIDSIRACGGDVHSSVFGVELDPDAHRSALTALRAVGLPPDNLRLGDFFEQAAELREKVDAVVGNPPFIRYQQFSQATRARAARILNSAAVRVPDLASSWAPFVIAGVTLLRSGGRLAMVVPMELCHARYAVPVLAFLARSFRCVQFLSFQERLFPELSQDTLLLLADGKEQGEADFYWKHLRDVSALRAALDHGRPRIRQTTRLETASIAAGDERLIEQFLSKYTRELYSALKNHPHIRRLGEIGDVGIGYVSGANHFFHLSPADVAHLGIPSSYLRKAVFRGRALSGLRFTDADWEEASSSEHAGYLLSIPPIHSLPPSVLRVIKDGEKSNVHHAYKCQVRSPWYSVPHVRRPDALLTYMSGISPVFVANDTAAVAPNTLHAVQMLPLSGVSAHAAAVAWHSSLTSLSVEIEGHAMGGGLLKLEPSEAQRVLLAAPITVSLDELAERLDALARRKSPDVLRAVVNRILLRSQLGLTEKECRSLQQAADLLRERRYARGKPVKKTKERSQRDAR